MKRAITTLSAAVLVVAGIGCGEQTGSSINGGDPVPERVNPEPPFESEARPLDVPDESAEESPAEIDGE